MEEQLLTFGPFTADDGTRLDRIDLHVTIAGARTAPAVFVPHALTGDSRVAEWWGPLVGEGAPFDLQRWRVIGINALGSCYGSTGPATAPSFPRLTVRDIVRADLAALDRLGVGRLYAVVGASLGGMRALQLALDAPNRLERAFVIGASDHQNAMAIALNALQREAIALHPHAGIRLARKIAMLSYKSHALLAERHDRRADRNGRHTFDVEGYLEHQGRLFEARMEPRSYIALTHAMDSFDLRPAPQAPREAPELHFIGISSDQLFPAAEVRAAAHAFEARGYRATYDEIVSNHGHDAFLAEPERLNPILRRYLLRTEFVEAAANRG